MSIFKKLKTKHIVAGSTSVVMALSLVAGTGAASAFAATTAELTQQINDLLAQIAKLQAQVGTTGGSSTRASVCPYTWSANLKVGSKGADVKALQQYLNSDSATMVASSGAGSSGNESMFFGPATKAAVMKFQEKYAADILTPVGLTKGTGTVGPGTRAKMNMLCATAPQPTPTPTPTPTPGPGPTSTTTTATTTTPSGTGLTVAASASQPVNSLAPQNAARVPFTKIDLTASNDGDVTVTGVVVKRQGLGADTAFAGVVLMNADGTLIGIPKTLNSSSQVTVGDTFTISKGTTKTVIIGANMAADTSGDSGETPSFAVVAINTSATVSGPLPIVGATHTVNSSLALGTVTVARGALDPGTSQSKNVGTRGYNFSSIKLTAGSAEDLTLTSIRWYQSGSAAPSDIGNVVTIIDGVSYPTVLSGSKYYTTIFPGTGLLIQKGFSKDITVAADINGGSLRTVIFNIDRRTDIDLIGQKYGYHITPPFGTGTTANSSSFKTTDNPYYDASVVTVSAGTMNVSAWTGVGAQNVAVNLSNQPLAGFTVDVKGEPISVGGMTFNFTLVGGAAMGLGKITNVTLVDQNGAVLAGPKDGAGATTKSGTISLTDTVTFPVGITNVTLKGKLGTDFSTNDTISASTTPSTNFTTVTGQVTGNTITPNPTSAVSGPTMTVKAGALTVTVSSQPTARTVIAGAKQFEFARYIFDAGQSGEDVRITSIPLYYAPTTGARTDLTNCQLFDFAAATSTSLTTGSNVKNPSASDTASSTSLTFDGSGMTVAKGTARTLSLKCDVSTAATGAYHWGIDAAQNAAFTGVTGLSSGQTVNELFNSSSGQQMTVAAAGTYTVTSDSSVLYKVAQAGASGVTIAKFKFEASTSEDLDLKQVALKLANTASSAPSDLAGQKMTLWADAGTQAWVGGVLTTLSAPTKIGDVQFGLSSPNNATSTLSSAVRVTKGNVVTLTVKGDLAPQDFIQGRPGAFVSVTYDGGNNGLNGNYATGADSGSTIAGTSGDATTNGFRVYRAILTIADVTTTTKLVAGSDLYIIQVSAASGRDVTMRAMSFNVTSIGLTASPTYQLFSDNGAVNATAVSTSSTGRLRINFDDTSVDRIIAAGTSKTYRLRTSALSGLSPNTTVTLTVFLLGDQGAPTGLVTAGTDMAQVATLEGAGNASTSDRFIWSPNSTTTSAATTANNTRLDWVNGYGLPGYPGIGQDFAARNFTSP